MGGVVDEVSDFVGDVFEGSKQIGEVLGYGTTSKKTKRAKRAAQERQESAERRARGPNLDAAQRTQAEADRVRRRRGVLANIYGGANASTPNVGTKTLLGS